MPPTDQRPIVVAGDVSIDWLAWPLPAEPDATAGTFNWRRREGTRMAAQRGGALLLADFLRKATRRQVVAPRLDDIEQVGPDRYLHSLVDLEPAFDKDRKLVGYHVSQSRGFSGPTGGQPTPQPPLDERPDGAEALVLDDAGNGFRNAHDAWKSLLDTKNLRWLIVKMARPLAAGDMWDQARHGPLGANGERDPLRLIAVVNADDLRQEGIALSRRISWERTAEDFVRELGSNGKLDTLVTCAHLIVRFDCDGVIYHRGRSAEAPTLYFDPAHAEGEFIDAQGGRMMGLTAAFTAALAAALADAPDDDVDAAVDTAIRRGMTAARRLAHTSFHADANGAPVYPHAHAVSGDIDASIVSLAIPSDSIAKGSEWSILGDTMGDPDAVARRIVSDGPKVALARVPIAQFGALQTADRRETESFRAIGNLLREYLAVPQTKPICIGVFGPPGAGKSFAVEQVAMQAGLGRKLELLEFNLSQFTGLPDLIAAFHLARDRALSGVLPVVFFDEFDCELGGRTLGWLRYFLAPMQDGKFREGGYAHPLGAAILVFAGGTRSNFSDFAAPMSPDHPDHSAFVDAKGPDFASRLRGHIDILGPDPKHENDHTYPIRRGFLLRVFIERREKALRSGDRLNVSDHVLNALVTIPTYRHGVRSMEAILAMSALTGQTRFEPAALPPEDQLGLHVDAKEFLARVRGERLDEALREKLGPLLHETYLKRRREIATKDGNSEAVEKRPSMREWDSLAEEFRESSRLQADDIPRKLRTIGCFMAEANTRGKPINEFSEEEIAALAKIEHERFNAERLRQHWRLGEPDLDAHTNPFLIPWNDLELKWRTLDAVAVAAIPHVLAKVGYRVYRIG